MALRRTRQADAKRLRGTFNGRMPDEPLNETLFNCPKHAYSAIWEQADDYNTCLPHSMIGYKTPVSSAKTSFAIGQGMPDPIANKALDGISIIAEALIRAG